VYGAYMAVMTVVFFWAMRSTDFFSVSMHAYFLLP
jgi:H+-transporting ATPase